METWVWVVIVVAIALLIGVVAFAMMRRRRTEELRRQFGPEYEVAVTGSNGRREAEAELEARRQRRENLSIRPLSAERRERFAESWRDVQARFVDAPSVALQDADVLVLELMRERGYPAVGFEQRAADISVDHPDVVRNYRAAHAVSLEASAGSADTERLREGLVHYRALFDELLETDGSETERRVG